MRYIFTFLLAILLTANATTQTISTFKSFDMPVDTFWNGSDMSGDFIDGILEFPNKYDTSWGGYWASGWAVSTMRDDSTAGLSNLYGIKTNERIDDSPYAIGQQNAYLTLNIDEDVTFQGIYITNTTYAYLSMKNGDAFAKKFGGDTGKDPDFFKLRIYALNKNGIIDSSNYTDFYLADFRFDEDSLDYIVDNWSYVDLSSLGYVNGLTFELTSSDVGQWGMNTPAFFAIDKIKYSYMPDDNLGGVSNAVSFENMKLSLDTFWNGSDLSGGFQEEFFNFECSYDTSYGGYWSGGFALSTMRDDLSPGAGNLYSSIPGGSYDGNTYSIVQNNAFFDSNVLDVEINISNIKIANTTYAYYSMKYGDAFAKKFGGETGDDPDYFKLRIYGIPDNGLGIDSSKYIDVYLADFRYDEDSLDYIADDWIDVDIYRDLGEVKGLAFELSSSDTGQWGMNTPAFFALDRIEYEFTASTGETEEMVLNIVPNPALDYIKIEYGNELKGMKYRIFNVTGQFVKQGILSESNIIDISGLHNGVFFIKAVTGNKTVVKRFVKASGL